MSLRIHTLVGKSLKPMVNDGWPDGFHSLARYMGIPHWRLVLIPTDGTDVLITNNSQFPIEGTYILMILGEHILGEFRGKLSEVPSPNGYWAPQYILKEPFDQWNIRISSTIPHEDRADNDPVLNLSHIKNNEAGRKKLQDTITRAKLSVENDRISLTKLVFSMENVPLGYTMTISTSRIDNTMCVFGHKSYYRFDDGISGDNIEVRAAQMETHFTDCLHKTLNAQTLAHNIHSRKRPRTT